MVEDLGWPDGGGGRDLRGGDGVGLGAGLSGEHESALSGTTAIGLHRGEGGDGEEEQRKQREETGGARGLDGLGADPCPERGARAGHGGDRDEQEHGLAQSALQGPVKRPG